MASYENKTLEPSCMTGFSASAVIPDGPVTTWPSGRIDAMGEMSRCARGIVTSRLSAVYERCACWLRVFCLLDHVGGQCHGVV